MAAALFAALFVAIPQPAQAADIVPDLLWPEVDAVAYGSQQMVTSPQGDVTVGCSPKAYVSQDLATYSTQGAVVRQISREEQVDGFNNCLAQPTADKNGDIYGVVSSIDRYGTQKWGSTILAYSGNNRKWEYSTGCQPPKFVIGADGNIYFTNEEGRLVGLSPDVEPDQTQPTKVLDIPIEYGSCYTELRSFTGGLIVSTGGQLKYYGYDGSYLGAVPGYWHYKKPNSDGRLFDTTRPSDLRVNAYDPAVGGAVWTTTVSPPGINVRDYDTYPLPGGGVLATFREQKMNGGTPATPTEYLTKLVVLDSTGELVWSKSFPGIDDQGNAYDAIDNYAVDTAGRIVLLRRLNIQLDQNPYWSVVTQINVFEATSGDAVYQSEFRGDLSSEDDPTYSYRATFDSPGITIGKDAAYVNVNRCESACNGPGMHFVLYPVHIPGLGLDYPRGAVLGEPSQPPHWGLNYVAMGDSFSSGEGVEPFEPGTAEPGVNECHRSELAYAHILDQDPELTLNLENDGFVACSGATTASITLGYNGEGAQIDHVSSDTDVITMSIGGNNMPFADFAVACVMPGTSSCDEDAYDNAMAGIANNVTPRVEYMLEALRDRLIDLESDATVLVIGYPQLVPDTWVSTTAGCWWLQPDELPAIREVTSTLNVAIENEVDAVGGNFHFVSPEAPDSPFIGHELCRNTSDPKPSYFLNYDSGAPQVYTFHPNDLGQQAYAELIKSYLAQYGLS
jgi:hypothetical protein